MSDCQCWIIWICLKKGQITIGWLSGWIWKLADGHGLLIWIGLKMARLSCVGADKLHINVRSGTDNGQIDMLIGSGNGQIVRG